MCVLKTSKPGCTPCTPQGNRRNTRLPGIILEANVPVMEIRKKYSQNSKIIIKIFEEIATPVEENLDSISQSATNDARSAFDNPSATFYV